jgi:hypothetical protein
VPPELLIIRFSSDVPASPVEKKSWGSIEAMFK